MPTDATQLADEAYRKIVTAAQRQLNTVNDAKERRALAAPIFATMVRDDTVTQLSGLPLGLTPETLRLARLTLPPQQTEHLTGRLRQTVAITALLIADDLLTAAAALEALPEQTDA